MSVYQTKEFAKFARKAKLRARQLLIAAREVGRGEFDADLGGGVFKQRIARSGGGKSGGFRTVLFFRSGRHTFFAHGFAKNEKANVNARELTALKRLADVLLGYSGAELATAAKAGELIEVVEEDGEEDKS